ncbi:glutathione peroxidase [Arsenicicoccus dermatophilus]|uniref:glutathione peroxidase n=1 Tax=Arsenicicoccus dermatophilus TaxID=1076331 RepID=UPI001F4CD54A|nr:glutathione peroxidase [Arsenicicoccus dermatophilus]MCH8611879.1 glutathione peroxidase [Arsenicicoccus dermatophilus]
MTTLHDFHATTLTGEDRDLGDYAGQAVLVVNTASRCGLTPQYQGLQELYDAYADRGLVVLGFPCDQFAHQEPGDADEIGEFCTRNYGVTFPMFAKVDVNGKDAHPLWRWLRSERGGLLGDAVKWNFTKFLVDPQGRVVERYAPTTAPGELRTDIERVLPAAADATGTADAPTPTE